MNAQYVGGNISTMDELALDDALACTFPASDPVAITFHTRSASGSGLCPVSSTSLNVPTDYCSTVLRADVQIHRR